ncbi:hypothetical protein JTB14_007909 [Gonioctena quinquepunctata]|nr:hypothetical protein JTB14_007909 [Gonioctena quinquepunctata]
MRNPCYSLVKDNAHLIAPRKIRNGPENLPIATKWSLHGPCSGKSRCGGIHTLHICDTTQTHDVYLHDLIKQSFSTGAFGVAAMTPRRNVQDRRALR